MHRDSANEKCPEWVRRRPTCVIMCGGRSSRFGSSGHKSMAPVAGKPVIGHVIDYWNVYTDDFLFVVKNGKEDVMDYVRSRPVAARFAEPETLRGIADGLMCTQPLLEGPFIMVLGDCFCAGQFRWSGEFDYAIGVLPNAPASQVCRNYGVVADNAIVTSVEEKPNVAPSDLCGMGFYFFQPDIFDHIRLTRPSVRTGEVEITDALSTLISRGKTLHALMLDGAYVNVTEPSDLRLMEQALREYPLAP